MDHCCNDKQSTVRALRERQARVLYVVLALNAALFVVEFVAGWLSGSVALLGDSLDMFADAAVYGVTLYVLHRSATARARASLLKGGVMLLLGLGVVVEVVLKFANPAVPHVQTMGIVGALALAGNVTCLSLLLRHRQDDLNMRSAWVCSRNDIIANVSVLGAAVAVRVTGSWLPDLLVGAAIALLFVVSSAGVLRESLDEYRASQAA